MRVREKQGHVAASLAVLGRWLATANPWITTHSERWQSHPQRLGGGLGESRGAQAYDMEAETDNVMLTKNDGKSSSEA